MSERASESSTQRPRETPISSGPAEYSEAVR
jgi:hypothetical protein